MTTRVDKRDIVAALTPAAVLEHFGVAYRISGAEWRFAVCPACGARSRWDAVSCNRSTGRWRCHVHDCRGDLLSMVAGFAGVDVRADFHRVLRVAADIAGVAA